MTPIDETEARVRLALVEAELKELGKVHGIRTTDLRALLTTLADLRQERERLREDLVTTKDEARTHFNDRNLFIDENTQLRAALDKARSPDAGTTDPSAS